MSSSAGQAHPLRMADERLAMRGLASGVWLNHNDEPMVLAKRMFGWQLTGRCGSTRFAPLKRLTAQLKR